MEMKEGQNINNGWLYLTLVILACLIIIGTIFDRPDSAVKMREIYTSHPFHFPEECDERSEEEFARYFQSKPENIDEFDIKAYKKTHLGDVVCKKPAHSTASPGKKILHLYTNGDLDKNFFQESD